MNAWYTTTESTDRQGLVYDEVTGNNIAVTYDPKDAALVAAAPEMLKALEIIASMQRCDAREWSELIYKAKDVAQHAIAKAKGD